MKVLKKFQKLLRKNTKNGLLADFYTFDTIPLINWMAVLQDSDLSKLHKKGKLYSNSESVYESVYDTYIRTVGISKEYKKLLDLMKRKALLQFDFGITLNRVKLNKIVEAETRLENFLKTGSENETTIQDVLIHLSKWAGYRINPNEILAKEYYSMLKIYQNENKLKEK